MKLLMLLLLVCGTCVDGYSFEQSSSNSCGPGCGCGGGDRK